MSLFTAKGLSYRVGSNTLVSDASFALEPGSLTALVGPNGAGKTSLLRLSLGLLQPDAGSAQIEGRDIADLPAQERARKLAYLPQARSVAWPQPVRDLIALGRFAFGATPERLSTDDTAAISDAIAACGLTGFEERSADTLSGGELSRVHLARALAAQTPVLIADEPIAALDPRHGHHVLSLFKQATGEGKAVLTVLHDLSLAARYADRLIWMKEGRIVADGTVQETMTEDRLQSVFGIKASVRISSDQTVSIDVQGPA